jgi:hypothetical protein
MNQNLLECHGCGRRIERAAARWVHPLGKPEPDEDGMLSIYQGESPEPQDGAEPNCPECRASSDIEQPEMKIIAGLTER